MLVLAAVMGHGHLCSAYTAQSLKPLREYLHVSWGLAEGLPGQVTAIAQSPDGYLWFGTDHGVLRFDGARFALFTPNIGDSSYFGASIILSPAMKSAYVTALLADRSNRVWIGTFGGGISRIENGTVTATYTKDSGLESDSVFSLHEDRSGNVWIGAYDGALYRFGQERRILTERGRQTRDQPEVISIADNGTGGIWLAEYGGISSFNGVRSVQYPIHDGTTTTRPVTLFGDDKGGVWVGTFIGAYHFENARFKRIWPGTPSPENAVLSIAKDSDDGLLLGTARGLVRVRNGIVERYGASAGLSADQVKAVFKDSAGNIWVGTSGGFDRLTDKPVTSYSTAQHLSSNQVWSVTEDRHGAIWVGTNNGLNRIQDGRVRSWPVKVGSPTGVVGSVREGPDGAIWFTTALGLCRLKNGRVDVYRLNDGIANDRVYGFTWRADGALVASARGGLFLFAGGKFTPIVRAARARSIIQGRDGSLWLNAHQLLRWKDGRFSAYGKDSDEYQYAYEDTQGTIWAGSFLGGLISVKGDAVTRFAPLGAPFSSSISYITEDRTGHFWIATPNGLFRVRRTDLIEYTSGLRKTVTSDAFGRAEGLPSFGCNAGEQNSGWTDRKGRIWVPTGRGIAMLDPDRIVRSTAQPHSVIEQIIVDNRIIDPRKALRLPADHTRIEFRYTGVSLQAPEYVRFRYQLQGFDKGWIDANMSRTASYSTMRPGTYRFRLLSSSNGEWNQTGPSFSFVVLPPFYNTWWFYLLCFVAIATVTTAVHRRRIRHIRTRAEIASVERMRIAQQIHDTLLQGVAGASLQLAPLAAAIGNGELRARFDGALDEMQRYMAETRRALRDLQDPDIGDWPGHLDRYGQALAASKAIHFSFERSGEEPALSAAARQDLVRLGQEAILNAVKHSSASELSVRLLFRESYLELSIADNGHGFEPESLETVQGNWGLKGMQERARQLAGELTLSSSRGSGTRITVKVDL